MILRSFFSRLCLLVAISILLICAGIGAITTSASYQDLKSHHLSTLRANTLTVFRAAVDDRNYPTIEQLTDLSENLLRVSNIEGGVFVNSIGDPEAFFGERPALTWRAVKLERTSQLFVKDDKSLDIFYDPEEIGLQLGLVLRVNIEDMWTTLQRDNRRKIIVVSAFTGATTLLISILVVFIFIVPLKRLERAVVASRISPHDAINHMTRMKRDDEIGDLGRALDKVFFLLTSTFEEDLSNAIALQEEMPMGLIVFSAENKVLAANDVSLGFLGLSVPSDIEGLDPAFVKIDGQIKTPREIVEGETYHGIAELNHDDEWARCMLGAHAIRDIDGAIRRYFLIFSDVSSMDAQLEELRDDLDQKSNALITQTARGHELRAMLEACTAMFDSKPGISQVGENTRVLPDTFIGQWYREAIKQNLMSDRSLRHGLLAPVRVDEQVCEQVFNYALSLVRARSTVKNVKIQITGKPHDGAQTTFIVSERTKEVAEDNKIANNPGGPIFMAALRKSLSQAGGSLIAAKGKGGSNRIAFTLPTAPMVDEVIPDLPEEYRNMGNVA